MTDNPPPPTLDLRAEYDHELELVRHYSALAAEHRRRAERIRAALEAGREEAKPNG